MSDALIVWFIMAVVLLAFTLYSVIKLFAGRINDKIKNAERIKQEKILLDSLCCMEEKYKQIELTLNVNRITKSVFLSSRMKNGTDELAESNRIEKKYIKKLNSRSQVKKAEAVINLGSLGTDGARIALENALKRERNSSIKLYIANQLADMGNKESIPVLVDSLLEEGKFYREKVNLLIAGFGEDFYTYLDEILHSDKLEMEELILDFASVYFSEKLKKYLINYIDKKYDTAAAEEDNCEKIHRELQLKACNILADFYPQILNQEKYLFGEDIEIKNIAVKALANFNSPDKIEKLLYFLRDEETARGAVNALAFLTEIKPVYFSQVVDSFLHEKDEAVKKNLVKILSLKIEYFMMKLSANSIESAKAIIKEILLCKRTSEIIDFLNKNKDINIENELISIIREVVITLPDLKVEFSSYLNERLVMKCGFETTIEDTPQKQEKRDIKFIVNLLLVFMGTFLFIPAIYAVNHMDIFFTISFRDQLNIFINDFNYYIAFYVIVVNLFYLLLLLLSYINVNRQDRLWKLKDMSFLFKSKMLPSISIIAPAFNEEKTIIESANSLLSLSYPDYELIIVNDGSKDETLNTLIKYYDLSRVDYMFPRNLNTKQVRGIYVNRARPKLIVVDKLNGGKADSLNVGINIANNDYVCGIDADSLLEDDALLKLASQTLDEVVEIPAMGGNILPINGCMVEHGHITVKKIPKNNLARFQTVEYIRSFMAGRLGWSFLNSLLIISGAFGLFEKKRILEVGGYLTSGGKYKKDTVGEDMELVVRISSYMKQQKDKFKILYAYHANCWTEVPEDLKTLKKQRFRWHRGLIEILSFHRKLLFNPTFGNVGMIAVPYFLIFEMLGPIFEVQGYIMLFLLFILGKLNMKIFILIIIVTILLGAYISVSSLLILERNGKHFSTKELAVLIGYSIVENFGMRQYFSIWRFEGYLNMFRKSKGWQKADRKGFKRN